MLPEPGRLSAVGSIRGRSPAGHRVLRAIQREEFGEIRVRKAVISRGVIPREKEVVEIRWQIVAALALVAVVVAQHRMERDRAYQALIGAVELILPIPVILPGAFHARKYRHLAVDIVPGAENEA